MTDFNAIAKPRTTRRVDAALFAELELLNAVAKMFGDDLGEHRDYLKGELGTDDGGYPVGEDGERTGEPA